MTVLTWSIKSDFDAAQSEEGVVHRDMGNGFLSDELTLGKDRVTKDTVAGNVENLAHIHINEPAAVEANGKIFFVWEGTSCRPWAISFDVAEQRFDSYPVKVSSNGLTEDTHGTPTLCVDNSGYLHIFWGSHNSEQRHKKSTNTYDITAWDAESNFSTNSTYPNPTVVSSGDIYVHNRDGTQQNYWKSTDLGTSWSGPTVILDFDPDAGTSYATTFLDPNGTDIHIVWCRNNQSTKLDRYNVYHIIHRTDIGDLVDLNGNTYSMPLDITTAENNSAIFAYDSFSNSNLVNLPKMTLDSSGYPHVLFNLESGGVWYVYHTYWNGSSWTTPTQITAVNDQLAGNTLIHYSDTEIVAYLTIGTNSEKNGYIEKWTWNGSSWSKDAIVLSETEYNAYGWMNPMRVVGSSDYAVICGEASLDYNKSDGKIVLLGKAGNKVLKDLQSIFAPLNEDSGSSVQDYSPTRAIGTIYGSIQLGQPGLNGRTCYNFDQSDAQYIEFADADLPDGVNGEFGACVWVNSNGYTWSDSTETAIDKYKNSYNGFYLTVTDYNGNPSGRVRIGNDDGSFITAEGTTNMNDDVWHFLAARCTGGVLYIYIDMVEEESTSFTETMWHSTYPLRLGKGNVDGNPDANPYQGKMQDARVWLTYCPTVAELQAIYDAATTGSYTSGKKAS